MKHLHLHGKKPCTLYNCDPVGPEKVYSREELRAAGLPEHLGMEAQGVCPDSGLPFQECVEFPCDCFMTTEQIYGYVSGCQDELIRQYKEHKDRAS